MMTVQQKRIGLQERISTDSVAMSMDKCQNQKSKAQLSPRIITHRWYWKRDVANVVTSASTVSPPPPLALATSVQRVTLVRLDGIRASPARAGGGALVQQLRRRLPPAPSLRRECSPGLAARHCHCVVVCGTPPLQEAGRGRPTRPSETNYCRQHCRPEVLAARGSVCSLRADDASTAAEGILSKA